LPKSGPPDDHSTEEQALFCSYRLFFDQNPDILLKTIKYYHGIQIISTNSNNNNSYYSSVVDDMEIAPNLSGSCLTLVSGMNDLAGNRANGQGTSLKVDLK